MNLNKNERVVVLAALTYMKTNLDDANDAFAYCSEKDPDNLGGIVEVEGLRRRSFDEKEVEVLIQRLKSEG